MPEKTVTESSIDFLLSNVNLSIGSYKARNKKKYNKIHKILDELVKMKKIKKKDLNNISSNI